MIELYAATKDLSRKEADFAQETAGNAHISQIAHEDRKGFCEPDLMLYSRRMRFSPIVAAALMLTCFLLTGAAAQTAVSDAPDYSGMYSFQKEGEFMQITLEDKGAVTLRVSVPRRM